MQIAQVHAHRTGSAAPPGSIHVVVDLNRCQVYAQCCFFASSVFELHGQEALWYDPEPDASQREQVLRVVIVGASLAGLRAAETLRTEGFSGPLTLIGDEPSLPCDRPPLSKAVVALGTIRHTAWLRDCRLAAGAFGVGCDAGCRTFDSNGIVTDDVFAAGDVARFPHPLYNYQFLALEHWGNAVEQAEVAAHTMICAPAQRRPHVAVPTFWSSQFGVNIKSVGVPSAAEEVVIAQGRLSDARCVAAYGQVSPPPRIRSPPPFPIRGSPAMRRRGS